MLDGKALGEASTESIRQDLGVSRVEQVSPVLTSFRSLSSPSFKRSERDEVFVIFSFFIVKTDGIL